MTKTTKILIGIIGVLVVVIGTLGTMLVMKDNQIPEESIVETLADVEPTNTTTATTTLTTKTTTTSTTITTTTTSTAVATTTMKTEMTMSLDEFYNHEVMNGYVQTAEEGSYLNVRKYPDADAERVGQFYYHRPVQYIDIGISGWYATVDGDQVCYVSSDYIMPGDPPDAGPLANGNSSSPSDDVKLYADVPFQYTNKDNEVLYEISDISYEVQGFAYDQYKIIITGFTLTNVGDSTGNNYFDCILANNKHFGIYDSGGSRVDRSLIDFNVQDAIPFGMSRSFSCSLETYNITAGDYYLRFN